MYAFIISSYSAGDFAFRSKFVRSEVDFSVRSYESELTYYELTCLSASVSDFLSR